MKLSAVRLEKFGFSPIRSSKDSKKIQISQFFKKIDKNESRRIGPLPQTTCRRAMSKCDGYTEESQNEHVCKNSGKSNLSTHQRSFCRNVFISFRFLARSILKPHSFTIRYVVRLDVDSRTNNSRRRRHDSLIICRGKLLEFPLYETNGLFCLFSILFETRRRKFRSPRFPH